MKKFLNTLKRDRITYRSFIVTILLLLAGVFFTAFVFRNLPPLVPIFTQLPWGVARLAPTPFVFLPIAIAFLVSFLNAIFAARSYEQLPLLSRFLALTSLLVTALMVIFVVRIIQLVL